MREGGVASVKTRNSKLWIDAFEPPGIGSSLIHASACTITILRYQGPLDTMSFSSGLVRAFVFTCISVLLARSAEAQWTPAQPLSIPEYNYSFLAATPNGDLLAATFNSQPTTDPPREQPALLIRNPASPNPQVLELCRIPFEPQRGYGGIACDTDGNFYVTGDTGSPETCFVRKFQSNGAPDARFGQGGIVAPKRRCLGVEVIGDYLMMAVDWGEVLVLDTMTGQLKGRVSKPPQQTFVRDIAVDPKSMRIFGVAKGSVVTWGRGAPWNTEVYDFRRISQEVGELRAGEGISIDPLRRSVLITPIPGNNLLEIFGNGRVLQTTVVTASPTTHLCDTVISFDGTTVFLSDIAGRKIHALRRQAPGTQAPEGRNVAEAAPTTEITLEGEAEKVTWNRSYTQVVQQARVSGKPMFVYFGQQQIPKCKEFQEGVLLTNTFNEIARNYVCVYEDVSVNRLTAYRFGAYRVPFVAILDAEGNTRAEYSFDINTDEMFEIMRSLNAGP